MLTTSQHLDKPELMDYAPHWSIITANVVRRGTPSHGAVLTEAMRLCEEETGHSSWNDIPDKYRELAIKNLINESYVMARK